MKNNKYVNNIQLINKTKKLSKEDLQHRQLTSSNDCLLFKKYFLCLLCPLAVVVSKLVSALSPVNYKRLHQGRKQTSIYLQVIHSTNYHISSLFFPNHNSKSTHNFGTLT